MKVKDLKPSPKNPRKISDKKLSMLKKCLVCGESFPSTRKFFSPHSIYNGKLYLRGYCRKCDISKAAAWRRSNPERAKIKACECTRRWRNKHRAEVNERYRIWRKNNLESALKKEATKRKKNPDGYCARAARYRDRHPDRAKAAFKKWQSKNLEYFRLKAKDRRDILRSNGGGITIQEWLRIVSLYPACPQCKREWSEDLRPTMDHITPISCGGKHNSKNIQPLCLSCNSRKKNHVPKDRGEKINESQGSSSISIQSP